MGKNLKGRECGKGIYQRKDGLYSARFVDRAGKRHEKYFQTVPEARNWIADAKYADAHAEVFVGTDITVDEWFDFWIENIVGDLAPNTLRNYRDRYKRNIQPVIGRIKLTDVKPMHCKKVFIEMDADYSGSTIRQAYITMGTMLKAAKMNDLISKHPMTVFDLPSLSVRQTTSSSSPAKNSVSFWKRPDALTTITNMR